MFCYAVLSVLNIAEEERVSYFALIDFDVFYC